MRLEIAIEPGRSIEAIGQLRGRWRLERTGDVGVGRQRGTYPQRDPQHRRQRRHRSRLHRTADRVRRAIVAHAERRLVAAHSSGDSEDGAIHFPAREDAEARDLFQLMNGLRTTIGGGRTRPNGASGSAQPGAIIEIAPVVALRLQVGPGRQAPQVVAQHSTLFDPGGGAERPPVERDDREGLWIVEIAKPSEDGRTRPPRTPHMLARQRQQLLPHRLAGVLSDILGVGHGRDGLQFECRHRPWILA